MSPLRSMRYTLERVIRGKDTISVTGNILRDYLTDLFPIMELGTSAKMLSDRAPDEGWQPVRDRGWRNGPEAGAAAVGGKPPELGLARRVPGADGVTGEPWARRPEIKRRQILARTLDEATGKLLDNDKSPSPKTGQLDNRGSHFYLAMYWAQALARTDPKTPSCRHTLHPWQRPWLTRSRQIIDELGSVQGQPVDIGGYFFADSEKTKAVMRPSATFNQLLQAAR